MSEEKNFDPFWELKKIDFATILDTPIGKKVSLSSLETDSLSSTIEKLEKCDLKANLLTLKALSAKDVGLDVSAICQLSAACKRITILCDAQSLNFDRKLYKDLFGAFDICSHDCRRRYDKLDLEPDPTIRKAQESEQEKCKALQLYYEKEAEAIKAYLNDGIAIGPVITTPISQLFEENEEFLSEFTPVIETIPVSESAFTVPAKEEVSPLVPVLKDDPSREEDILKEEESSQISETLAREIPYYERTVKFSECRPSLACKAFSFLKIKGNKSIIYLCGFTDNINGKQYDNSDESLLELIDAGEIFYKFATVNILNEGFYGKLSDEEKKYFKMYYDFMDWMFKKYMRSKVSAIESRNFNVYINKVIGITASAEHEKLMKIYPARIMADTFLLISSLYGINVEESAEEIAENICNGSTDSYLEIYRNIYSFHVADEEFRHFFQGLQNQMKRFPDPVEVKYPEIPRVSKNNNINVRALDDVPLTEEDLASVTVLIKLLNQDNTVMDEEKYSMIELEKAVSEFLYFMAPIKRLYIIASTKKIMLFQSIDNDPPVATLTQDIRKEKGLDGGAVGKIVDTYEESIAKAFAGFMGE